MIEDSKAKIQPLWTKSFFLVMTVSFLMFTSMYILLPTLPGYAVKLGGDEKVAGLIIGLYTVAALAVRPWVGNLLDRRGRKVVLIPGIAVFILSSLAYNWISAVWLLLAFRLLHGVGWGATTTSTGTISADVIPAPRRAEGMGYAGISMTLAMAVGPALGLYLVKDYSYTLLFMVSGAIALAALVVSFFINYEGIKGHGKTAGEKGPLIEKTAVPPALVLFFITLTYGGVITFLPQYAKFRGIENIGLFFTVYALILFISRPITGKLADRFGSGPILVPGIFFVAGALVTLVYAKSLGMFLFSGVLYAIGFSAVQPVLNALTISLAPIQRRGAANATIFSSMDLGIGLGAVILGVLSENFGYAAMYGVSAAFPLVALVVYFVSLKGKMAQLQEKGEIS